MVLSLFPFYIFRDTLLSVAIPKVELDDGSCLSVLDVHFIDGNTIQSCPGNGVGKESCTIICKLTFTSPKPVSFTTHLVFSDGEKRYVCLNRTS